MFKTHVDIFSSWDASVGAELRQLASKHGAVLAVTTKLVQVLCSFFVAPQARFGASMPIGTVLSLFATSVGEHGAHSQLCCSGVLSPAAGRRQWSQGCRCLLTGTVEFA